MDFLISGQHVNPIYLMFLGFVVGVFGGFFGVGGSFLAGPGLFAAGVPMNFVVGTDLAHIVGKSIVATRKHLIRGNVDMKLGLIMACESWLTIKMKKSGSKRRKGLADESAISHFSARIQRIKLPPMIKLPSSGIKHISLWIVLAVAYVGGVFAGLLGGGAGYIRMPSLVYILGVPTHLAVGTDLFEIIISASYGTFSHAVKGNV